MVKNNLQDSHFTAQVRHLVNRITDKTSQKDSMVDRATVFFQESAAITQNRNQFEQELTELQAQSSNANKAKQKEINHRLDRVKIERREYQLSNEKLCQVRHKHLRDICYQVLDLTDGENFSETLRKSAQLLGTLQLISPIEGGHIAETNSRHKDLYKAVLCLRLLDELIINNQINDPFINQYLAEQTGQKFRYFSVKKPEEYKVFTEQVKISIIMAALLQDIGRYHPSAQQILYGDGNEDPYRTIEVEQRKTLLQVSYQETNNYLIDGLGPLLYLGNSREEKDSFIRQENEKLTFIRKLLKSAINPQNGIGNLLKVPQIYTSIILSTKDSYNYKVLPKVYSVLNTNAERGACRQSVVDSLYKITGMFPQGYGVTYIPKAVDQTDMDFYEYAIVCQFYPENPAEPICRQATRNLTYISYGHDLVISKKNNLYFQETALRFSRVTKKRLLEILEPMVSNFEERKNLDVLPRCWSPNDYFSEKNNQKLWNKHVD